MNFSPTLSEVKRIADTGRYDVLPVSCEILSDFITPIETLKILKNVSTHCYMLESAQANETRGRYTFLGFDPKMEITCMGGEMKIGHSRSGRMTRPAIFARFFLSIKVPASIIFLPLQADLSAIFRTIILHTANRSRMSI